MEFALRVVGAGACDLAFEVVEPRIVVGVAFVVVTAARRSGTEQQVEAWLLCPARVVVIVRLRQHDSQLAYFWTALSKKYKFYILDGIATPLWVQRQSRNHNLQWRQLHEQCQLSSVGE